MEWWKIMLICYAVAIPVCACLACCSMRQEKWKKNKQDAEDEERRKNTYAISDAIKKIGNFNNSNNDRKTLTLENALKNVN
jgi:hypothetical protein